MLRKRGCPVDTVRSKLMGKEPTPGTIAHRIWRARVDMDMTQRQIATACGVAPHTISRYEVNGKGSIRPTFDMVCKIAKALDVSLAYMAGYTTEYGAYEGGD